MVLPCYEAIFLTGVHRACRQLRASILVRINAETLAQQRLQALAVAEERSRVKNQFMATMTHELRTPLYGILGLSQLARGEHSREALLQRLDLLDKSGESLLAVIDDLLDFSQLESGEVSVRARPVDLHALVREVQGVAAHTAQNKGLDLLVDARLPTPCVVACDPMRVRQVLLQLLGNAFKFTEEGSVRLRVELEMEQKAAEQEVRVRFAITDTGIGIDARQLPYIFEPFHQVDGSMARRYGGVGIGLTRARQIARAMGGEIRCSSEPGHGSTFTFEFPAPEASPNEPDAPDGERSHEAALQHGRLAGVRVLLAEDNPVNALVIVDQLERLGAQVQAVADGQAAVQAVCTSPAPDLVLMDCQMPGVDGFEAARRIRAYERAHGHAPVPIMAITALAGDADLDACLAAGMNGRLVKPVSMRALERELKKVAALGAEER